MTRIPWLTLIALSCAGSLAGVRLARPFALDDMLLRLLFFGAAPAVLILLAGILRRPLGVLMALLLPVMCLYTASRPDDPFLLWAAPLVCGAAIICVARAAQDRQLSRLVPAVSVALVLGAFFAPAPGRTDAGPRAVLIGVEGLTRERIDELIAAGRLPHLARLERAGHRARLTPLLAADPGQVWCAVATGIPPGIPGPGCGARPEACRAGRIWEQAKRAGRTIGVCGWCDPRPSPADLGPHDFALPGTCARDARAYPPEYGFLARFDRRPMRDSAPATGQPTTGGRVGAGAWLDAVRRGARLSTLRRAATDLIAQRRSQSQGSEDPASARGVFWALQADICAELIRTRRPEFATILFTLGAGASALDTGGSGDADGALCEEFDRAVGKLLRATPAQSDLVIVSPGTRNAGERPTDGVCWACGPAAGGVTPADSLSVLDIAPALAALLGLPAPPWPPSGYTGIQ